MRKLPFIRNILFFIAIGLILANCGSGSGDDDDEGPDFSGAGNVGLSVKPKNIDVGDRTLIELGLSEVNDDGIVVKIRFPDALQYVKNSATLVVKDDEMDITPDVEVSSGEDNYLVFFISRAEVSDDGDGTIKFELLGKDELTTGQGQVEVDIDVDNPLISNDVEFNVEQPDFQAEDTQEVVVEA